MKKIESNDMTSDCCIKDVADAKENFKDFSCAHNLHQNMQALTYLLEKVDVANNVLVNVADVAELKQSIHQSVSYFQSLENKNRNLEAKIDVVLKQNEIVIRKCTQLEEICESFFSKVTNLENRMLALEYKAKFSNADKQVYTSFTRETIPVVEKVTSELNSDLKELKVDKKGFFNWFNKVLKVNQV
jgi:hypothetical protein